MNRRLVLGIGNLLLGDEGAGVRVVEELGTRSCSKVQEPIMPKPSLKRLLVELHKDQRGAISLETVLILGAIALPILIFLLKVGWPMIKGFFVSGVDEIDSAIPAAKQ